ncbi:pirin family protein [Janthinobacterium sp. HLX7-2]|uniref:pirin family protein n=1 Tax=Janthinobacterium sp. HLX7-2 TaxID=1259331 RepID=UPI003F24726F
MKSLILKIESLGSPWKTIDPFLVCAHHVDHYPRGNNKLGPNSSSSLDESADVGFDEAGTWNMYFGRQVPGFPAHPHRGFETITIMRKGVVDHSDSMGNSARYAEGDVQWLTAGRGILHAEMFPLLNQDGPNPFELFQIWLNLPAQSKMVKPNFKMFWAETIPTHHVGTVDDGIEVRCIVGQLDEMLPNTPPTPPANSWAARPGTDLAIWTIKMAPGAKWTLPPADGVDTRRQLLYFSGKSMALAHEHVNSGTAIEVCCSKPVELVNGSEPSELLLLQGRPIGETVVQDGPFVMNSTDEISQAYADYRLTQFGGWDWSSKEPTHGRKSRFESL